MRYDARSQGMTRSQMRWARARRPVGEMALTSSVGRRPTDRNRNHTGAATIRSLLRSTLTAIGRVGARTAAGRDRLRSGIGRPGGGDFRTVGNRIGGAS